MRTFRAGSDVKKEENKIAEAEITEVKTMAASPNSKVTARNGRRPRSSRRPAAVKLHGFGDCVLLLWIEGVDGPVADEIKKLKVVSTKDVTKDTYKVVPPTPTRRSR